ncbi:MAG: SPOR domain-containing protein [Polyangiaceae bacterium]
MPPGIGFASPSVHGCVKPLLAFAASFALSFVAASARADSYSWEATSGRFHVSVFISGFNEGAGEGGWDERSARDLASFTRRFNAIIPPGATVDIERDVNDDRTTLTIRNRGATRAITMPGGPDLDAALALVAEHFHVAIPPAAKGALFTVQLSASRSEDRAEAFASDLDARGVVAEGSFYDEACHPCSIPGTRVLDRSPDGLVRVISGVFDEPRSAEHAAAALRRAGIAAWARGL